MTTVVIMPGGFHPFHAGHLALYQSAQRAFPDAEVFVAATNDTSARPFPFAVKEKLAQLAGVEPGHFVQVRSPFRAEEITKNFDPETDHIIFVRSEKDANKPPQAGGIKKDGNPAYLQPLLGAKKLEPFARHAYMAYLPTVEFGPGFTSASEIRAQWPTMDDQAKIDLVHSLYPATKGNDKLAQVVVKMLDTAIIAESVNPMTANTAGDGAGMTSVMSRRYNQPPMESNTDYIEEKWSEKYKRSINCSSPRGFSQRAHCAGRRKTTEDATSDLQKDLRNPYSYDAIDHMMTAIAKKHSITPKKLHDIFVEKHGCTPDDWIRKQKRAKLDEKCWDTPRQVGMKKKGNRMVPNCVPRESK